MLQYCTHFILIFFNHFVFWSQNLVQQNFQRLQNYGFQGHFSLSVSKINWIILKKNLTDLSRQKVAFSMNTYKQKSIHISVLTDFYFLTMAKLCWVCLLPSNMGHSWAEYIPSLSTIFLLVKAEFFFASMYSKKRWLFILANLYKV